MPAFGGRVYFFVYSNRDLSTKNSLDLSSFFGRIEDEKGMLKAFSEIYAGKKQKHAGFFGKDSRNRFRFCLPFSSKTTTFKPIFPLIIAFSSYF